MGEQRQIRSRSWNRMPTKRCSANGITNEFIVVDDDEVIILDFPESSKGNDTTGTSRDRNELGSHIVISLDDDEVDDDVDETGNVHKAGSSQGHDSLPANLQTSAAEVDDDDDCQFVREKYAGFRFSRCRQTFSTKAPSTGVRFGLGPESDSDYSDSDCSDCEILDGSRGEVREQWEKAFFNKMKKPHKPVPSEEAGPSKRKRDKNFDRRTQQQDQESNSVPARNPDGGTRTSSTVFGTNKSGKAGLSGKAGPSNLPCETYFGPTFERRTEQHDQASNFVPARNPDGGKETDGRNPSTSLFGSQTEEDNRAKNGANSRFSCKEKYPWSSSQPPEIQVEHQRSNPPSTHFTSSKEPIHQNSFKEVDEQPDTVQVQCETSQPSKGNQMKKKHKEKQKKKTPQNKRKKKAVNQSCTNEDVEEDASKSSPPHTSNGDAVLGSQSNSARCENAVTSLGESSEMLVDPIPSTSEQVQGFHGAAPEIDIMLNREKLKETDEYKKAQEEEWESRQQQLQLQAEEAQRQRKRRKLANTRQLEMERRQKERVEEVRETQKKDEESMNMKEKIRTGITKSLKILELKCINMASLLRGLGIQVGGGTSPLPHEVHAAYRRAVLKFHPDRASRGDIKQQVEAEEKFKLIARMKDKFLS
ncbi:unnamed protein product [Cochlearia groenlandica]